MTQKETVQLGIEFERRLIEIDPSFEVENKPDTETIYAFLSEYAKQYFDDIIKQLIITKDRDIAALLQDKIKDLIREGVAPREHGNYVSKQANSVTFEFPEDYYIYIRSYSNCLSTYKFRENGQNLTGDEQNLKTVTIENNVFSEYKDSEKINNDFNDGFILRNPLVLFENKKHTGETFLTIIKDKYTVIKDVTVIYYKRLDDFTILKYGSNCELSPSCFWDIVKGAVDLYIYSYKFGVTLESLKRKAKSQLQDQQNNARPQQQEDDQ